MGKAEVSLLHMIHWQLKRGVIFIICFTNSYVEISVGHGGNAIQPEGTEQQKKIHRKNR